jgi:DNA-binding NarL/FixJ family response regulator
MPDRMRVLVVEESAVLRERMALLAAETPDIFLVGLAENGSQALQCFRQQNPDAVVLDIELADGSGLRLLQRIKKERPICLVAVLANYHFREYRQLCTTLGADYFLLMATESERVFEILSESHKCHDIR